MLDLDYFSFLASCATPCSLMKKQNGAERTVRTAVELGYASMGEGGAVSLWLLLS
jgi:hypothetical protein